jgi:glycerol-3-phosphate cytidylyltransferase
MRQGRVGFTCSTMDLFHAGHVAMLEEAKRYCDWLIVGIQSDPTLDRKSKNKPVQSIVERQIQVRGCRFVDEVWVYDTEKDLEDMLNILPINVRILGDEYQGKQFTGLRICQDRGIDIVFNERRHGFSSSGLRARVFHLESAKWQDAIEQ